MATGPAAGAYPIGPELTLRFQAAKNPGRSYLALLSAIIAAVLGVVGAALLKDHPGWGIPMIGVGALLGLLGYYLWTGRVKLPGK